MKTHMFSRSVYDTCVYMEKINNEIFNLVILVLYVNYMLILSKIQSDVDRCKNQLKLVFKIKYLGEYNRILGIDIHKNLVKKRI